MKELLPQSHQLMYQFFFEEVGPYTYSSAEYIEVVVERNFRRQVTIYYPRHRLPQDLHQTNYSEFTIPLCDHDGGFPGTLIFEVHLA